MNHYLQAGCVVSFAMYLRILQMMSGGSLKIDIIIICIYAYGLGSVCRGGFRVETFGIFLCVLFLILLDFFLVYVA